MLHAFCNRQNLRTLVKQLGDFDDDNIKALVDEYIQSFESDIRGTLKGELKAMSEGSGTDADIW